MPNVSMNGKASNTKYISAEEAGTKVVFRGNSPSQRRLTPGWLHTWTRLELTLTVLCLLLAIVTISLIIVVSSPSSNTGQDSPARSALTGSDVDGHLSVSTSNPVTSKHGTLPHDTSTLIPPGLEFKDICLTPGCVNAAARIIKSMDGQVAPCDNFFDFACGNWNRLNTIPADKAFIDTFSKLEDEKQAKLKNLLEPAADPDVDTEATIKAKNLYISCMNETQLDVLGLQPALDFIQSLGGWPVLQGDRWDPASDQVVVDLLVKLALMNNKFLVDQWVSADEKDSDVNIIQLDQSDLGMSSPDYFLQPEAQPKLAVYQRYIQEVALMFGADPELVTRDVEDIISFETELAKIMIPKEERRDSEEMYNKMTIRELAQRVPTFHWMEYLQKIFSAADVHINETEQIVVCASSYFIRLGQLYAKTSNRVKINYLVWRAVMKRVTNLPSQYRNVRNDYVKTIMGSQADPQRWHECVTYTIDNMGNAVGRLFVEAHFDEGSKETALEIIHDIRNVFYEMLEENEWMNPTTKIVAKEKADAISEKIGYPDYILNDTALNQEYENVQCYPDRYFQNTVANLKHMALVNLRKLRQPVDRDKWLTTPAVVNAFYSPTKNQIMFPAAIFQPPFYSKDYPKSLNYGGIGMIIGHEITHGFDDRGRQYDKKGILVQWWPDDVIKKFKERAQCIIDQYSNYSLPEVNMKLNGIQCQGENIADNGGLKEAYRAYKKYTHQHGSAGPRLPGLLHFTSDQLFFINFAQIWCGVMRPEYAINKIKTGNHSPGRFRVIGSLQNFPAFSDAFRCPANSYMNRAARCTVW